MQAEKRDQAIVRLDGRVEFFDGEREQGGMRRVKYRVVGAIAGTVPVAGR
jgi:hypothetical protein